MWRMHFTAESPPLATFDMIKPIYIATDSHLFSFSEPHIREWVILECLATT